MTLTLYYRYKDHTEQTFSLLEKEAVIGRPLEVVVGRPKDVPVHIDFSPDTRISRPHARLYYDLSAWWIEDLGSKHGTLLNGRRITEASPLSPHDQLQLGDTFLRVEFETRDNDPGPGDIDSQLPIDETRPPIAVPEDKRIEVLARVSEIAANLRGDAMLEGFLREMRDAFPRAERMTILLVEDRELLPCAFWPPGQSHVSFTLARRAMKSQTALRWVRQDVSSGVGLGSLYDTSAALYAPLVCNGRVTGVIHIDSTSPKVDFNESDLGLLSVIANTIGPAIKANGGETMHEFPSVFLSYAHQDGAFVRRLAADLRRRRVKVWFDERLRSGAEWQKQLTAAIENTDAFILVLSPSSLDSPYVKQEIDIALSEHKKVFPLLYQNCTIPDWLASIQYIDFRTNHEEGVVELAHELYDMPRQPFVQPLKEKEPMRILFLAANPLNTNQLRLSEEVRTIDERLRTAEFRDRFELLQHWAVRPSDLSEYLLRHTPHIVHFSGHGSVDGKIVLEDANGQAQPVSAEGLGRLLGVLKDNMRCVVLNACWSAAQAHAIAQEIDCVVGMSQTIGDQAAIKFAGGFYRGLGYGRSVKTAFDLGCSEIELENLSGDAIPQLLVKPGVDATRVTLV